MGEPHQGFIGKRKREYVRFDASLGSARSRLSDKCVASPPGEFVHADSADTSPLENDKHGIGRRAMPPRRQATARSLHMKADGRHGRRCQRYSTATESCRVRYRGVQFPGDPIARRAKRRRCYDARDRLIFVGVFLIKFQRLCERYIKSIEPIGRLIAVMPMTVPAPTGSRFNIAGRYPLAVHDGMRALTVNITRKAWGSDDGMERSRRGESFGRRRQASAPSQSLCHERIATSTRRSATRGRSAGSRRAAERGNNGDHGVVPRREPISSAAGARPRIWRLRWRCQPLRHCSRQPSAMWRGHGRLQASRPLPSTRSIFTPAVLPLATCRLLVGLSPRSLRGFLASMSVGHRGSAEPHDRTMGMMV
jgi:hypothetical protein